MPNTLAFQATCHKKKKNCNLTQQAKDKILNESWVAALSMEHACTFPFSLPPACFFPSPSPSLPPPP